MGTFTIYGSSDDTIVVHADNGYLSAEFAVPNQRDSFLAFSDGTILSVHLTDEGDDGIWRIKPVTVPDRELLTITTVPADESDGYSDRAELRSDLDWVVLGTQVAHNRH